MTYYLIAGEASGDLHGSNLMKAILDQDPEAKFRFWGGDLMAVYGGKPIKHIKETAVMGFWEVLKNAGKLKGFIDFCKKDIKNTQPDALILIDYAGFNLKIAAFAKSIGIPVHFYIAPKVWAWNEKRVEKLRKYVDHLYVIFPFEKDFFEHKHNLPVHYVGNPLQDVIMNFPPVNDGEFRKKHRLDFKPIITLLPGSRHQEISHMLPLMSKMEAEFPNYQFVIAGAPHKTYDYYQPFIKSQSIGFVENETYNLLSESHAALVTSGTATLETALFKVPQVVCYHSSVISYHIAKILVKDLKYISLVNLVLDKPAVTELIQNDFNYKRLKHELQQILTPEHRHKMYEDYFELEEKLGGKGASQQVAEIIIKSLFKNEN